MAFYIRDKLFGLLERIKGGDPVTLPCLPSGLPEDAINNRLFLVETGIKSLLALPNKVDESVDGGLIATPFHSQQYRADEILKQLHYLGEISASALEFKWFAERN